MYYCLHYLHLLVKDLLISFTSCCTTKCGYRTCAIHILELAELVEELPTWVAVKCCTISRSSMCMLDYQELKLGLGVSAETTPFLTEPPYSLLFASLVPPFPLSLLTVFTISCLVEVEPLFQLNLYMQYYSD